MFTPNNGSDIELLKEKITDVCIYIGIEQITNPADGTVEWHWGSGKNITDPWWCPDQPASGTNEHVLCAMQDITNKLCFHDAPEQKEAPFICHHQAGKRK